MVKVRKDHRGKDEKIGTDCKSNGVGNYLLLTDLGGTQRFPYSPAAQS